MPHFSIFGYYGQGNAGDEAILAALIDGIHQNIPRSTIGVYSANIEETESTHGVKAYRFFGINPKSIIKGILRKSRITYIKSVFNFFKSDVIVIGGGGLFFDSKETNKWIYGYIDLIHRAKRFRKKVALIGISVGPLHHEDSKTAIGDAFNRADLISVRDDSSRELLICCGVDQNKINVIPDLVFTLNSAADERIHEILEKEKIINNGKKNIALTPCSYNTQKEEWHNGYAAFCNRCAAELDVNIWFIPMQRSNNHDDLSAINEIYPLLSEKAKKQSFTITGSYSAREIQGIIGKADFVFAERLHGSIMAINGKRPVLSIAYMPKVNGVLELANLPNSLVSMSEFLDHTDHNRLIDIIRTTIMQTPPPLEDIKTIAYENFRKLNTVRVA